MRFCIIAIVLCVLAAPVLGQVDQQAPEIRFVRQFGSLGPPFDAGLGLTRDPDGNLYVVGQVGGPLPDENGNTSYAGLDDCFIRKYDASGNLMWSRQFGTSESDMARGVAADASGVYMVGETGGSLFGALAGVVDAFIVKYSLSGTVLWDSQFGTSASDVARGVAVDDSGVYVVGDTSGALKASAHMGGQDAFIRKFNGADGSEIWTDQFGSTTNVSDVANGVVVCGPGVCVVGRAGGTIPGQTSASPLLNDAFARMYDPNGSEIWTRQFGTAGDDQAVAVAADASGIYVAGQTMGALGGPNKGQIDAFVRQYDAWGASGWTNQFGTTQNEVILAASMDANALYVGGNTRGTTPPNVLSDPSLTGTAPGTFGDAFLRKMEKDSGSPVWTHQFGGPDGSENVQGIATDGSSEVYVTGLVGGVGLAGHPAFDGSFNVFFQKYEGSGSLPALLTQQFGAGPGPLNDFGLAVAVDGDGNTYVGGQVDGALPGKTSAGFADAYVRKYSPTGAELWTTQFGGTRLEAVNAIAVDGVEVYVGGGSNSTLPGQQAAGGTDSYIMKLDASTGVEVWTRQFGVPADDAVNAIAIDATGVYVAGRTRGKLGGGTHFGLDDAYVQLYTHSGTLVWSHQFGTAADDRARAIAVGASGVFVAGETRGSLNAAHAGQSDVFVSSFDFSGNIQSTPKLQFGTAGDDVPNGIALDEPSVYLAGQTAGALPGQVSAGLTDAFLRKYDLFGGEVWTQQFGTPATDVARCVAVDPSGLYTCGQTGGSLPGQSGAGTSDAFVENRDTSTGNLVWRLQYGTAAIDVAAALALDTSNPYNVAVLVAGWTDQSIFGQTSSGRADAYVLKIEQVTTISIDVEPGSYPNSINLGSNGRVPIAILSTPTFDASAVDPLTVDFVGANVSLRGRGTPMASLEDVNGDGRPDLVVHVTIDALQLTASDTEAELRARTFAGTQLKGTDSVRIVP